MTGPLPPVRLWNRGLGGALLRYRVMAWLTGTALLILVLVGVPLRYLADSPDVDKIVGFLHGAIFYLLYIVATLELALVRLKWPPVRVVLLVLAGTVPAMSFVAERFVTRQVGEILVTRRPDASEATPAPMS